MHELEFLTFVLIVSWFCFRGYRNYRKEEHLEREEAECHLKRDMEKHLKREEEKRLKREEEERLEQEEAELKQLEFENSPAGRLQKAIKISEKYELFSFISKIVNCNVITETDATPRAADTVWGPIETHIIRKAEVDALALEAAGIKLFSKAISFTFDGLHYSIVIEHKSESDSSMYSVTRALCHLLVDGKVVLQIVVFREPQFLSYTDSWFISDLPNTVKLIKLDAWLEQIPYFLKAHEQAQTDETIARELEQKRRDKESLDKNISLGKFDQSE